MLIVAAYQRFLRPGLAWTVAVADTLRVALLISVPALLSGR